MEELKAKRENYVKKIWSKGATKCITGFVVGATLATICTTVPLGSVDLGHGLKMSKAEFTKYEQAYKGSIKDAALEMVVVENALKDKGVEITKSELNKAIKDFVKESKEQGVEITDSEAMMGCKVQLLSDKAIEKFKETAEVKDEDVEKAVAQQNDYSLVSGQYKVVSQADADKIRNEGIAFNDIDSKCTVIEHKYGENITVNDPKNAAVGKVSFGNATGDNVLIILVESITNDTPTIREMVKSSLKEQSAQSEFQTFVSEALKEYTD